MANATNNIATLVKAIYTSPMQVLNALNGMLQHPEKLKGKKVVLYKLLVEQLREAGIDTSAKLTMDDLMYADPTRKGSAVVCYRRWGKNTVGVPSACLKSDSYPEGYEDLDDAIRRAIYVGDGNPFLVQPIAKTKVLKLGEEVTVTLRGKEVTFKEGQSITYYEINDFVRSLCSAYELRSAKERAAKAAKRAVEQRKREAQAANLVEVTDEMLLNAQVTYASMGFSEAQLRKMLANGII